MRVHSQEDGPHPQRGSTTRGGVGVGGRGRGDKAAQREGSRAVIPWRTRWAGRLWECGGSQARGPGVPGAGGKTRQGVRKRV